MKKLFKSFALTALCLFLSVATFAQITTSSMSGKVIQADGEPALGATVIATHVPSGTQYYAMVDNSGNYRIPNMRPGGPYTVETSLLGFGSNKISGIQLTLAENYLHNVKLTEESFTINELVVTADGAKSSMKSERAGATTSLNLQQMNSIPVVSRNLSNFVKMTPQSSNTGSGPQIGGGTYRQNNFTIDGAAMNNAFGIGESMPAQGAPISMDALEQISINVTPFDVRQTGFLGGAMNATTRSGDNKYRASVYSYYYNEKFRGDKTKNGTFTLNDETNLVYGARVGGPIIKDKLFFFLSAEAEKVTAPGPSKVAATPEHPFTTGKDGVARPTASTLDAISNYLKSEHGYSTGKYQGYSAESPSFKLLGRLDWNISRDHKINVRYNMTKSKSPSNPSTSTSGLGDRNALTGNRGAGDVNTIFFQNARYFQETNYSSFAGELSSRFLDGTLSNLFRVTYSHQDEPRSTEGGEFPFIDLGVGGKYYTSFGTELFSYGNLRDVKTFNVTDELTYSFKKHFFTLGLQYERNRTQNGFQRFGAGYYQYNFATEADLMSAITAKTLLDNPHQYAITHSWKDDFSQAFPEFTFNQFSVYLQDEVTFSDNFRMQAGIRFEIPSYPELNTYNKAVAEAQLKPFNGNDGYYNTAQLPETSLMISPRISFNWDILGNRDVVLRGGTGFFTGRLPFVWIVAQAGDSGVLQNTYTAVEGGSKVLPKFHENRVDALKEIYPSGVSAASAALPSSFTLMADNLKMPQTWKTSLGVDFKLPLGLIGSVEGIYNYDIKPVAIENVALKDPTMTTVPNYADNRYVWGDKYVSKVSSAYLLKNADKNGYYYSITAKLEKPFWNGLYGMVAYTYSNGKSLNDGWGDQVYSAYQSAATVNGNNFQTLGYASYIMPHRLIANLSYSKEYAKNFRTGISLFYEGGPTGKVSYTYTKNIVGDGGANNLIYVPKSKDELTFVDVKDKSGNVTYAAADQAEDFWNFVNNNKYLKTRKGQYAERNGLVYPWVHQFDLKITQDFFINSKNGDRNTLQLGFDIKNLGNLLNKNWGNKQTITKSSILTQTNKRVAGGAEVPTYNFERNGTEVLKDSFQNVFGTSSTYLMQFSIRYMFN